MAASDVVKLQALVDLCSAENGTNERVNVMRKHGHDIKELLGIIYDPFRKFYTTSANILKYEKACEKSAEKMTQLRNVKPPADLLSLLTMLAEGLRGHDGMDACLSFIHASPPFHRDIILRAINKDLKMRTGTLLVNKAFPMLVPVFGCALSHPLENHQEYYEKNRDKWWISRKLDGCRCMFVCQGGKAEAYSRSGHVYPAHIPGLDFFLQQFGAIHAVRDFVLDGEMGVVDDTGKEHFNIANSIMNPNARPDGKTSKHGLKIQPGQFMCYFAFDFIPLETFKRGSGGPTWTKRQKLLKEHLPHGRQIRMLEQVPGTQMDRIWEEAESKGWEGLILRLDADYQGKKTRQMLKRKMQADLEFEIEDATTTMQMSPDSTVPVLALEHVGVTHRGSRVWVGSGFTWAERLEYAKAPKALIGRQITVKHYGETQNKDGGFSLRHPVVKAIYDKKTGRDR